jgi:hypothetical protein
MLWGLFEGPHSKIGSAHPKLDNKKVLLAVCHGDRVRARFSDGIILLDVVKEAKVSKHDRFKRVADGLNQKFSEYSEEALVD